MSVNQVGSNFSTPKKTEYSALGPSTLPRAFNVDLDGISLLEFDAESAKVGAVAQRLFADTPKVTPKQPSAEEVASLMREDGDLLCDLSFSSQRTPVRRPKLYVYQTPDTPKTATPKTDASKTAAPNTAPNRKVVDVSKLRTVSETHIVDLIERSMREQVRKAEEPGSNRVGKKRSCLARDPSEGTETNRPRLEEVGNKEFRSRLKSFAQKPTHTLVARPQQDIDQYVALIQSGNIPADSHGRFCLPSPSGKTTVFDFHEHSQGGTLFPVKGRGFYSLSGKEVQEILKEYLSLLCEKGADFPMTLEDFIGERLVHASALFQSKP